MDTKMLQRGRSTSPAPLSRPAKRPRSLASSESSSREIHHEASQKKLRAILQNDAFDTVLQHADPKTFIALVGTSSHFRQLPSLQYLQQGIQNLLGGAKINFAKDNKEMLLQRYIGMMRARLGLAEEIRAGRNIISRHKGSVESASFSPDQRFALISATWEHPKLWDLSASPWQSMELEGDRNARVYNRISSDQSLIVTTSRDSSDQVGAPSDQSVRVWNLTTMPPTMQKLTHRGYGVRSAQFSRDGNVLMTASRDVVKVWDLRTSLPVSRDFTPEQGVSCASLSTSGRFLFIGSPFTDAQIHDLSMEGSIGWKLEGLGDRHLQGEFDLQERHLVTKAFGLIKIWNLTAFPTTAITLTEMTMWGAVVKFSPDGQHVAETSSDNLVRLWDVSSSSLPAHTLDCSPLPTAMAYSSDGRFLVVGSQSGYLDVFNLTASPATRHKLDGHKFGIRSAEFSKDGHYILTASSDGTVRFWQNPFDKSS